MEPTESARPDKMHRVVIDLHPVQQEALDRAKRKFREAMGVSARDSDIGKNAFAKFCERQGETFPDPPARSMRPRLASRYESVLKAAHAEHPEWGPAALARAAGCSLTSVRRILPDLPILAPKQLDLLTREGV